MYAFPHPSTVHTNGLDRNSASSDPAARVPGPLLVFGPESSTVRRDEDVAGEDAVEVDPGPLFWVLPPYESIGTGG